MEVIAIRGARTHNLKNVDVDIPRDQLTVITGVSGSGKSSLAFDTLYAEGQRQYIESLSVYARQFFHQLERPSVDSIEGLQPTLCLDQRQGSANPRSTVGTLTEVHDYLRVLMARAGTPSCYQCGRPIAQQSLDEIQASILKIAPGSRIMILASMVRGRRGAQADVFAEILRAGVVKIRIDREMFDVDSLPRLDAAKSHTIDAVVDRIVLRAGIRERLGDAIRLAVRLSQGLVICCWQSAEEDRDSQLEAGVEFAGGARPTNTITAEQVNSTGESVRRPTHNGEEFAGGARPTNTITGNLVNSTGGSVRRPTHNGEEFAGGARPTNTITGNVVNSIGGSVRKPTHNGEEFAGGARPTNTIPAEQVNFAAQELWQEQLYSTLYSCPECGISYEELEPRTFSFNSPYGACTTCGGVGRIEISGLDSQVCPECLGARLRREALAVRLGGKNIRDFCSMPIDAALEWVESLKLAGRQAEIADAVLREILPRLRFLCQIGVEYLTLDRAADTLSGGELQRVRLATSLGSGLVGVCYILDEPSIGLHARDTIRLIEAMRKLQLHGNTVIVVEHDEAIMREADCLIDVGPGAGKEGGCILAIGSPDQVAECPASITAAYLRGERFVHSGKESRRPRDGCQLLLEGVTTNNLKNIDVLFPLGLLVGITGVSGSGKSSLMLETLAPALRAHLGSMTSQPGPFVKMTGAEQIERLVTIDQSPIGRSPRSTPATYSGVFDEVRKVFVQSRDAKQRGFGLNRFSFNAGAGRCESCQGQGQQKIEMGFLPDVYVTCIQCHGRRYNRQTLQVKYKGCSIADVLEMSIDEAAIFFENFSKISHILDCMRQVGLGYLSLGQSSATLSGGEAQRIKLATELSSASGSRVVYLLDEPTTGLHFEDVGRLLAVLDRLVEKGNSVFVIEHNLDIIRNCDWLIDLGPEGGLAGGYLLAQGPPSELSTLKGNMTGQYIRRN